MTSHSPAPRPEWLADWETAWPRPEGDWTVYRSPGNWGRLDPEAGTSGEVDPAADPALPALAEVLGRGDIVGYRAGRRAVVRTGSGWVKVVRPKRLEATVSAFHRLAEVRGLGVRVPKVVDQDPVGWFELSPVSGSSLHDLLGGGRSGDRGGADGLERALGAAAGAMRALHRCRLGSGYALASHAVDDPHRWVGIVGRSLPALVDRLAEVANGLPVIDPGGEAVVHTDLHDKNVLIDPDADCPAGLIDLDGLRLGRPEVDVANLAVHIEMRAMQSGADAGSGRAQGTRLREEYERHRPLDPAILAAVEAHTWFRLSCLYRFRRSGDGLVDLMLDRTGVV